MDKLTQLHEDNMGRDINAPFKCLAVKSAGGKLEDWEYTPEPLGAGDVGEQTLSCRQLPAVVQMSLYDCAGSHRIFWSLQRSVCFITVSATLTSMSGRRTGALCPSLWCASCPELIHTLCMGTLSQELSIFVFFCRSQAMRSLVWLRKLAQQSIT